MQTVTIKQIDNLLKQRLGKTEKNIGVLTKRIDKLERNIDHKIDDAVAHIIASVDKTKADKKAVKVIEDRITVIEEKLETASI